MAFELPYDELEHLRQKFTVEQIQEFRNIYALFDQDSDGIIRTDEVGHVMRACGLPLTEADLQQSLDEFSGEDPENVDFPQFLTIMARKYKPVPKEDDMNELRAAFKVFDKENNGYISAKDLRDIIVNLGEIMSAKEADRMIKDADIYGEGFVNIEAFIKLLCSSEQRNSMQQSTTS